MSQPLDESAARNPPIIRSPPTFAQAARRDSEGGREIVALAKLVRVAQHQRHLHNERHDRGCGITAHPSEGVSDVTHCSVALPLFYFGLAELSGKGQRRHLREACSTGGKPIPRGCGPVEFPRYQLKCVEKSIRRPNWGFKSFPTAQTNAHDVALRELVW